MPFITKIGYKALRTNLYHILLLLNLLTFGVYQVQGQEFGKTSNTQEKPIALKDSIQPSLPTIANDSIPKDSIAPPNKEAIQAIIEHNAEDYILENVVKKEIKLRNNAEITYQDIYIKSGEITINYNTNVVHAKGIKDSVGKYTQLPLFKQGGQESTQDSITYNFKTKKALIYGFKTAQGEMLTLGEKTKMVNDSTIFIRGIKFTTDDKKNPDYYLATSKAKVVPGKKIIVGPTNLVIADVPTPLFLPFAYFPLTSQKTSGIIMPTYGESSNQGVFLQNGGYYFAGNDYFDLTLLGDIYSNGSWGVRSASTYKVRYKYSGNVNFRFENLIYGIKGFDDYSKSTNYNILWSHSQDSKSNPNSRFSASVNMGSSKYYKESINLSNTSQSLINTLSSSVSYYKKFVGTPFNMSVSASHTQNTNTEIITMSLPSLQLNMDRIYPFAPKSGSKQNALQKTGLTYSLKGDNKITTTDEFFFKEEMFDAARSGVQQDISLSTNMKFMKYLTLSPSVRYKEVWYLNSISKEYDASNDEVVTTVNDGFTSFREYSGGASVSTSVYGMFNFDSKKLKAIRHTLRPSIGYSYRPDFSFYNEEVQQSEDPTDVTTYSPYNIGLYGTPSSGVSNSLSFSVDNNLEAKVVDDDPDNGEEFKKVTILNNLRMSTSYNMAADSLKWSPVGLTAGTVLFKKKLNVNMSATLNPYAINANGKVYDEFNIKNNGSLFRLTNANLNLSYSVASGDFKKDKKKTTEVVNAQNTDMFGPDLTNSFNSSQYKPEEDDKKKGKDDIQLYNAKMPWNLRISYSGTYLNTNRQDEITNSSLIFSGDVSLTPNWQIRASSGYDFKNQGFTYTTLGFSRDLDSWRFSFNWVPLGDVSTYYFYIGVKSSVLSDLKWEKRKVPDRSVF